MISNMPSKTGKSLDEWKKVLSIKSFTKHSEALNFLKTEYGVSHGFANTIVALSKDGQSNPDDLLAKQYQGKEHLSPIYNKLKDIIVKFGDDIKIVPKKDSVSFVRKRQFILIKPATKSRVDIGLKLKDFPVNNRLENSGPFGTMCTHRVKIENINQINSQLVVWLEESYHQAY